MKKLLVLFSVLSFFIPQSFALTCIDLQSDMAEGSRVSDVKTLQNFLIEKGMLESEATGYFGPLTVATVMEYQDSVGLPDTGLVGKLTRDAINKESCSPQVAVPSTNRQTTQTTTTSTTIQATPTTSITPTPSRTVSTTSCLNLTANLSRGDENQNVTALQNFYLMAGFLEVAPNGYFGPSTFASTKEYQESLGLSITGVVDDVTRSAIKRETCNGETTTQITNVQNINTSTVINTAPTQIVTTTSRPTSISTMCLNISKTLSRGDESDNVLALQNFLLKEGFLEAVPNGYFGPSTFVAVKEYQSTFGIPVTGTASETTLESIKNNSCSSSKTTVTSSSTSSNASNTTTPVTPTPSRTVSTTSCLNLTANLSRGDENQNVTALQNFYLMAGFLEVAPNGYFGPSTFASTKEYQESLGLSITGVVDDVTREAIRKETCGGGTSSVVTQTVTSVPKTTTTNTTVATSTPTVTAPVVVTPNEQRQKDVNAILMAMYQYYKDSNGTYPVPGIMSTSTELCSVGIGECPKLIEVSSFLVPKFLSKIPRDPTITTPVASTSPQTGYNILRDANNQITITAPKATGGATIMARCNFAISCQILTTAETKKLAITSIDHPVFISGGPMNASLVIRGEGFTPTGNTVSIISRATKKTYTLGEFSSTANSVISATSSFTVSKLPCGSGCLEKPALGDYDVLVKNENGESNFGFFTMKSITAASITNGGDISFTPKTTHMKLGSVTLSSDVAVTVKTLKFSLTGTTSLVNKVSNFTITDTATDKVTNGGPAFTLPADVISNNQTKIYDLYADIADIENYYAGRIVISSAFTVTDNLGGRTITVPVPDFMISISY